MASYPKIRSYTDNAFPATFNINDFTTYSGYATLGDLLSYANIYNSNMFYSCAWVIQVLIRVSTRYLTKCQMRGE